MISLDLSKIEAGKIEILTDEVNVTEIPQMMKNHVRSGCG